MQPADGIEPSLHTNDLTIEGGGNRTRIAYVYQRSRHKDGAIWRAPPLVDNLQANVGAATPAPRYTSRGTLRLHLQLGAYWQVVVFCIPFPYLRAREALPSSLRQLAMVAAKKCMSSYLTWPIIKEIGMILLSL